MRRAKVIDRADQKHPRMQRQSVARQHPATAPQRREAFTERCVQPLNVRRIDHPAPLRPAPERLHACRRAIGKTAFGLDHTPLLIALDDMGDQDVAPRAKRGRPPLPVCTGSRKVSRIARMWDDKPSVQTNRGRRAAQRLTRAIRR
jgi:hypothetical protein